MAYEFETSAFGFSFDAGAIDMRTFHTSNGGYLLLSFCDSFTYVSVSMLISVFETLKPDLDKGLET